MKISASDHVKLTELLEEQTGLQERLEQLYCTWEKLAREKDKAKAQS